MTKTVTGRRMGRTAAAFIGAALGAVFLLGGATSAGAKPLPPDGSTGRRTGHVPASVPCNPDGHGRYNCFFYPAGNGRTGGALVKHGNGRTVGYLHRGVNWVICQRSGAKASAGAHYNHSWAFTLADNNRHGWVNAVHARGGDDDGPFAGVPDCGNSHGQPPGGAPDPSRSRTGRVARGEPPTRKTCESYWVDRAEYRDYGDKIKMKLWPTKPALVTGAPAVEPMWDAYFDCIGRNRPGFHRLTKDQWDSLWLQHRCHVHLGIVGRPASGPTFDYESWHPNRGNLANAFKHGCN